jgi:glyoxylase I family protein
MSLTSTPRVHHFAISVADLETTVAWYSETLGFREEFRYEIAEAGLKAVFLGLGDLRLEIFEKSESRAASEEERSFGSYLAVQGLKHVALAVDDLGAVRAELEQAGVEFVSEIREVPNSGGERFCFLSDPDGVLIELYQPVAARAGATSR